MRSPLCRLSVTAVWHHSPNATYPGCSELMAAEALADHPGKCLQLTPIFFQLTTPATALPFCPIPVASAGHLLPVCFQCSLLLVHSSLPLIPDRVWTQIFGAGNSVVPEIESDKVTSSQVSLLFFLLMFPTWVLAHLLPPMTKQLWFCLFSAPILCVSTQTARSEPV